MINQTLESDKCQLKRHKENEIHATSKKYDFDASSQPVPFIRLHSTLGKRIGYIIASILTLGLVPLAYLGLKKLVATLILPATWTSEKRKTSLEKIKADYLKIFSDELASFRLKTHDRAEIDGVTFFQSQKEKENFEKCNATEQKWVIVMMGNGSCYEDLIDTMAENRTLYKANVLSFNYRGVGKSKGNPSCPQKLYIDGETCVQYLLSKGVREENIIIEGHSLSGAVGAQVAAIHKKINYISDRSFGKLTSEIKALIKIPVIGSLAAKIIKSMKWEMDSLDAWERIKGKKLVVFHKEDRIIPYKACLYKAIKDKMIKDLPSESLRYVFIASASGKIDILKKRIADEEKPRHVKLSESYFISPHNQMWLGKDSKAIYKFARQVFHN